ncbi:MAG: glycoside hydrolase family 38 C-terminal domain-containing protein [Acidimicrobiia bacterium]
MTEPIDVAIVPHTHWDREWYGPFQTYRLRLVRLLDGLLPALEEGGSFAHFCLDGQTAMVDDYLAVRPGAAARLEALASSGRISLGPWAVLMDEFMVSGETIIRNLAAGRARARALGTVMNVGYLPDMFGHVAQMPQILRLAGLSDAVVWRGVPGEIDRTAFWWEAPDGSVVRAEYLWGSYSNGRDLPTDGAGLVNRAADYERELGPARLPGGGMLIMNGTDHQLPQPGVGPAAEDGNRIQGRYRFRVTSLAGYLAAQPTEALPRWRGELRSGARANLLMGVTSNRVDVRRAAAAAEGALERRAEPLLALFRPASEWAASAGLLAEAWSRLILNSAHDSSCACSADEVVEAVLVRYHEARQIAEGLASEAVAATAAEVDAPPGAVLVVNPGAGLRSGLVETVVTGDGPMHFISPDGAPLGTQVVETRAPALVSAEDVASFLDSPRQTLLVQTGPVAGFGWTTLRPAAGPGAEPDHPARAGVNGAAAFLDNSFVRVEVDPGDGTVRLAASGLIVSGCNRYVDGGDGGDTYNWSPPDRDWLVTAPASVQVSVVESGPLRARVAVDAVHRWPAHADGDERSCGARAETTVDVPIRTTYELRAGDPVVGVEVEVDNRCRDHRLRAHLPLPSPVAGSDAGCAFAVVRRGLAAEGGPTEHGLPTFPARRFVDCSDGTAGLAVLTDELCEYEVTEAGRELALTVLRAVGFLSRLRPALRPNAAGPPVPVAGAQMQGRVIRRYGLLLHRGGWEEAALERRAAEFARPLEVAPVPDTTSAVVSPAGATMVVEGAVVSAAVRDGDGALVLRCYNPTAAPSTLRVALPRAAATGAVVDLDGNEVGRFSGSVELRPAQIVTLRLS